MKKCMSTKITITSNMTDRGCGCGHYHHHDEDEEHEHHHHHDDDWVIVAAYTIITTMRREEHDKFTINMTMTAAATPSLPRSWR